MKQEPLTVRSGIPVLQGGEDVKRPFTAAICALVVAVIAATIRAATRRDRNIRHAARSHRDWIDYGAGDC